MAASGPEPTDDELIKAVVSGARSAGLRESEIARVLREEFALDDDFSVPVAAGRLYGLIRASARGWLRSASISSVSWE